MSSYSPTTRRTQGICDRCGQAYQLDSLREEYVLGQGQGNRVCRSCWDPDHPQNYEAYIEASDPQQLRDPRPEDLRQAREVASPTFDELLEDIP